MGNELDISEGIKTCGYIISPLYNDFVHWAEKKIQHPNVYGMMRGADALVHSAHKLSRLGVTKTGDWRRLYVNVETIRASRRRRSNILKKYLETEGITKDTDVTMIDDDVCYGYTSGFIAEHCKKLQALAVNVYHGKEYDSDGIDTAGFLNEHVSRRNPKRARRFRGELFSLTQISPRAIKEYDIKHYNYSNGQPVVITYHDDALKQQQDLFYEGLDQGLEMCANGKKHKKNRTNKYLEFMADNLGGVYTALAVAEENKKSKLSSSLVDYLAYCKKRVEKLYG